MDITTKDFLGLLHPMLAVIFIFPLIGIVVNYAWQTRQRRLQTLEGGKSKIPPAGPEHLKIGRWLSNSIVVLALIGISYAIFAKLSSEQGEAVSTFRISFLILMIIATLASLVILNRARTPLWRGIFATLTGMGIIILGCQPEVFRRGYEWYISHYYYGITATMLMIFSLAIYPDIYKDRTNRWRNIHVILNCIALLLFIGQGFTGTRDLLEIPLSWQEEFLYKCDYTNLTCPK
jgi:MFS family permease